MSGRIINVRSFAFLKTNELAAPTHSESHSPTDAKNPQTKESTGSKNWRRGVLQTVLKINEIISPLRLSHQLSHHKNQSKTHTIVRGFSIQKTPRWNVVRLSLLKPASSQKMRSPQKAVLRVQAKPRQLSYLGILAKIAKYIGRH